MAVRDAASVEARLAGTAAAPAGLTDGWQRRWLVLALVLLAGLIAVTVTTPERSAGPVNGDRWPREARLFAVDSWTTGPERVEEVNSVHFVTRDFLGPRGTRASLTLKTSTDAKRIYASGADVPFLGSGFSIAAAPAELAPPSAMHQGAFVAQRAGDKYLGLYAYGERRGALGASAGWGWALFDGFLDRPNDYYLLTVVSALRDPSGVDGRDVTALADALFPRVAAWYAATGPGEAPAIQPRL